MKIIKRSQLALLSLSFMVMIAGYINYKYDSEREKNLGQTVHVSGSDVFLYDNTGGASGNNVQIYKETIKNNDTKTNMYNTKTTENTIATFREQRDDMFSELESTYKEVISKEQEGVIKEKYQDKLDDLVNKKHLINIVESLIKSKGIENIVIIPTGENINIVVKSEEKLTDTQAALIEKIIEDEFKIGSDKISISQSE